MMDSEEFVADDKIAFSSFKNDFERAIDTVFEQGNSDHDEVGNHLLDAGSLAKGRLKLIETSLNAYLRFCEAILPIVHLKSHHQQQQQQHNPNQRYDQESTGYAITFYNPILLIMKWWNSYVVNNIYKFHGKNKLDGNKLIIGGNKKQDVRGVRTGYYRKATGVTDDIVDQNFSIYYLFSFVFLIYATVLAFYMFQLQFELYSYRESWTPMVREGANRTEKCALKPDIYPKNKANYQRLLEQRMYLLKLGFLSSANKLFNPVYLSTANYGLFSSVFAYLFAISKGMIFGIEVDQFLKNPGEFRQIYARKARQTLTKVYRELRKSRRPKKRTDSSGPTCRYAKHYSGENEDMMAGKNLLNRQIVSSKKSQHPLQMVDGSNCSAMSLEVSSDAICHDYYFVKDARPSPLESYVQPACFRLAFRNVYISFRYICVMIATSASCLINFFGLYLIIYFELESKFQARQALLYCQSWNPKAVPIKEATFTLDFEQPWSDGHRDAFLNFRNNRSRYIFYELKQMTYFRGFLIWFSIDMARWYISIWTSYNLTLVSDGMLMKLAWTKQVLKQMENCLLAVKALASINSLVVRELALIGPKSRERGATRDTDDSLGANALPSKMRETELILADKIMNERMESALIVTYCNFELLRQARTSYKDFNEYFSIICVIALMSLTLLMYTIFHKLGSIGSIFVFSIILISFGLSNTFFVVRVIITQRHQQIHFLMNELVGNIGTIPGDRFKPISRILQRNVMLNSDVQSHYSTSLLGMEITRSTLISLNSYALGAMIFLFLSRTRTSDQTD